MHKEVQNQDLLQEAGQKMIRSPHFRNVYSNTIGFNLTNNDITIIFGAQLPSGQTSPVVQEEVAVTIPFPAIKTLSEFLPPIIKALEKEIGTIRIPKAARPSKEIIDMLLKSIREADLVD